MNHDAAWQGFNSELSQPCPVPTGARIELISMPDDPDPIEAGARGTVTGGNGGQIFVKWDNGRSLILLPAKDTYRVITEEDS